MQFIAAIALLYLGVAALHALAFRHFSDEVEGITGWLARATRSVPGIYLGLGGLSCLVLGIIVGTV